MSAPTSHSQGNELVSVIIPTYNCSELLSMAVDSVLRQSYGNVEIIVVDDGSTDDTREKMAAYHDRVIYVFQENQGVSVSRNRGMRLAGGEFIAFLDADDIWLPEKLEKQLAVFADIQDCIAVFSDFSIIHADGETESGSGILQDYGVFARENKNLEDFFEHGSNDTYVGWLFPFLYLGNFINTCSLLVRREAALACGLFDTALTTQEDYDYWLRLSQLGRFAYVDVPLVARRKRINQLTHGDNMLQIANDVVKVVENHSENVAAVVGRNTVRKRLRDTYKNFALNSLKQRDADSARRTLLKSIARTGLHPVTTLLYLWSYIPYKLSMLIITWSRPYRDLLSKKRRTCNTNSAEK